MIAVGCRRIAGARPLTGEDPATVPYVVGSHAGISGTVRVADETAVTGGHAADTERTGRATG
jgi:hypothetical protein